MTRLVKMAKALSRYGTGAVAALILLAACAGHSASSAADTGPPGEASASVEQSYHTDYDALYDELADA
jgi:hypothetical protein